MRTPKSRFRRGTTLIEAMIALTVMLIGMAGFASLQVISVRANHFAKRISMASAVATDLTDTITRAAYNAPMLNTTTLINSCTTSTLQACLVNAAVEPWDLGTADPLVTAFTYPPDYSDSSVGGFSTAWMALPVANGGTPARDGVDIDRDGVPDFFRYWNVYDIKPTDSAFSAGKFTQVYVRWKEPGFGYRQVTSTSFKYNPAAVVQ
jgi:Tfp pilus assembly protein PilV